MATQTAKIIYTVLPGVSYVITYKKASDSIWIVPPNNPTVSSPFYINGLETDVLYDLKIQNNCGLITTQFTLTGEVTTVWVEDTFTCEQDTPFTLADEYIGFSSPYGIYWHETKQKFYVVDNDDTNGVFYNFDPTTITGPSSVTYIPGSITQDINGYVIDKINKRIIAVGDNTGGALVLDVDADTITTLPYGTNTGGIGGAAIRLPIGLSTNYFYAFQKTGTPTIRIYNRGDLTISSTKAISTVPTPTNLSGGYSLWFIGSEIWVTAASRSNGNIARYNSDFTSLNGEITLTGIAVAFTGGYWQQGYYDESNNKFYIGDSGSHRLYVIDTTTNSVISSTVIPNLKGKSYCTFTINKSDLDGQIYCQIRGLNSLSDSSSNYKLYRIDSNTGEISFIYPNTEGGQLTLKPGSNEQWAISPGLTVWDGGAWATDGKILKYI